MTVVYHLWWLTKWRVQKAPQLDMIGRTRGTRRNFTDQQGHKRYNSVRRRQLSSHFDPVVFILAYATEVFPNRNVQSRGPKVFTKIHRLKSTSWSTSCHLATPFSETAGSFVKSTSRIYVPVFAPSDLTEQEPKECQWRSAVSMSAHHSKSFTGVLLSFSSSVREIVLFLT